jgi:hypothetical protein
MNTLYVAGDSFATISKLQVEGSSWSEMLAKELKSELENVSRSGASHLSIAIQLDYITNVCQWDDYVIIVLTDNFRKTLPVKDDTLGYQENRNLLSRHDLNPNQKNISKVDFTSKPYYSTTTVFNSIYYDYLKKYYDFDLQLFEDIYVMTGILSKALKKTNNLYVCLGGFGGFVDEIYNSKVANVAESVFRSEKYTLLNITSNENLLNISHDTFGLSKNQFINLTHKQMLNFGRCSASCNHLSIDAHAKIFRIIHSHIMKNTVQTHK